MFLLRFDERRMGTQKQAIIETFGNKLRVRVCGIYIEEGKVLMVRHQSVGKGEYLWAPPGGGMEFGQDAKTNLKREFFEETGLDITVGKFLFVHEFLGPPLHAIELFYAVEKDKGVLKKGEDPEMTPGNQIIDKVTFLDDEDIQKIKGDHLHNVFNLCNNPAEVLNWRGYFKFDDTQES